MVPERASRPALEVAAGYESDGPELEVAENDLLHDEEPHSQPRPSSAGILPARARAALAAGVESDRALRDLLRTAQFLSATVQGVCEHSQQAVRELEALDSALEYQAGDYRTLHQRVGELEAALDGAKRTAAEDRQFLLAQQDAFILTLVAEHEQALKALLDRLAEQEKLREELTDRLAEVERELAASRGEKPSD